MATECFKMLEFTQKHSPFFIFQVENLLCTLCLQIKVDLYDLVIFDHFWPSDWRGNRDEF